jgi:hypothetical protein
MLRYALPATLIVGGFVVALVASFEQPNGIVPRTERPAWTGVGPNGSRVGSVVSVTSEQSRLQSEVNAMTGALRSAAARQLQEFEDALTGPKARSSASPAAAPPASQVAGPPVATVPASQVGERPVAATPAAEVANRPASAGSAPQAASPPVATAAGLPVGNRSVAAASQTATRPVAPAAEPRALAARANVPTRPPSPPAPRQFAAVVPAQHPEIPPMQTLVQPGVAQPPPPEVARAAPAPPAVAQLVSADQALQANDPVGARGLLEAAETSVVFAPARNSGGDSVAAAQITEALQGLQAGDRARAMQCVAHALAALRRGQYVSAQR